jgi:hypothetical protein
MNMDEYEKLQKEIARRAKRRGFVFRHFDVVVDKHTGKPLDEMLVSIWMPDRSAVSRRPFPLDAVPDYVWYLAECAIADLSNFVKAGKRPRHD